MFPCFSWMWVVWTFPLVVAFLFFVLFCFRCFGFVLCSSSSAFKRWCGHVSFGGGCSWWTGQWFEVPPWVPAACPGSQPQMATGVFFLSAWVGQCLQDVLWVLKTSSTRALIGGPEYTVGYYSLWVCDSLRRRLFCFVFGLFPSFATTTELRIWIPPRWPCG